MATKTPVISLRDITKTYVSPAGEYTALKDITLDIHSGDFVAIMGPSGSGKSTLMHIMGALDTPTSGVYKFNGKNISNYTGDQLAEIRNKEIGFVFQAFNLLPRTTVIDNVIRPMMYSEIPKNKHLDRGMKLLSEVGLADKANNLSNHISGGQVQRVAIARALVMNPSVILADEPTGNLDSKTAFGIMDFLLKLNKAGNTIVIITHEEEVADYARRKIFLRDGLLISDKTKKKKRI